MKKIETLLSQAREEKQKYDSKLQSFSDRRQEAKQRIDELTQKLEDYTDGSFEEYVETKSEIDKLNGFIELLNKQEKAFTSHKPETDKDRLEYMKMCQSLADELRDDTVRKLKKHVLAIIELVDEEKADHDKLLEIAYTNLSINNVPDLQVDGLLGFVRNTSKYGDYNQIKDLGASAMNFKDRFEKSGLL